MAAIEAAAGKYIKQAVMMNGAEDEAMRLNERKVGPLAYRKRRLKAGVSHIAMTGWWPT